MGNPTEAFLMKVEEIAQTSFKLRAILNKYGGYEELPSDFKRIVQQSVEMMQQNEKKN